MTWSINSGNTCGHIFLFSWLLCWGPSVLPVPRFPEDHSYFQMSASNISFFLDRVSFWRSACPQDTPIYYWRDTIADASSHTGLVVPLCGTPKITTQHLSFLLNLSHPHRWTRAFHSTALLTFLCQWERILIGAILVHLNSSLELQLSNIRH